MPEPKQAYKVGLAGCVTLALFLFFAAAVLATAVGIFIVLTRMFIG